MANKIKHIAELSFPFCFEMPKFVEYYLNGYGIELLPKKKEKSNSYKTFRDGEEVIIDIYPGGLFLNGEELTVNNYAEENRNVRFKQGNEMRELKLSYFPGKTRDCTQIIYGTDYLDKYLWIIDTDIKDDIFEISLSTDYKTTEYKIRMYIGSFGNVVIDISDPQIHRQYDYSTYLIIPGQKHGTPKEIADSIAQKFKKPSKTGDILPLELMTHDPRIEERLAHLMERMPKQTDTTYDTWKREQLLAEYNAKLAELDEYLRKQRNRESASGDYEFGLINDEEVQRKLTPQAKG